MPRHTPHDQDQKHFSAVVPTPGPDLNRTPATEWGHRVAKFIDKFVQRRGSYQAAGNYATAGHTHDELTASVIVPDAYLSGSKWGKVQVQVKRGATKAKGQYLVHLVRATCSPVTQACYSTLKGQAFDNVSAAPGALLVREQHDRYNDFMTDENGFLSAIYEKVSGTPTDAFIFAAGTGYSTVPGDQQMVFP